MDGPAKRGIARLLDPWGSRAIQAAFFAFPAVAAAFGKYTSTYFALIAVAGLAFGFFGPKLRLARWEKVLLWTMGLYVAALGLSLVNASDLSHGISRWGAHGKFLLFIPIYILIRRYRVDVARPFLYGLAVAAAVMCAEAVYQTSYLHFHRAEGGMGNPIPFGFLAALTAGLLLEAALLRVCRWWQAGLWAAAASAALYASILSQTRTAWAVVVAGVLLIAGAALSSRKLRYRAMVGLMLVAAVVAAGWPLIVSRVDQARANLSSYENGRPVNSVGVRLDMWRLSLNILAQHPLLGTGLGDYNRDAEILVKNGQAGSRASVLYRYTAHSNYFHFLAVSGAVGFLAMVLSTILVPMRIFQTLRRRTRGEHVRLWTWAGVLSVAAFAVYGTANTWAVYNAAISLFLVVMLAWFTALGNVQSDGSAEV